MGKLIFTFLILICLTNLFAQEDEQKMQIPDSLKMFKRFKLPHLTDKLFTQRFQFSDYDNMPLFKPDPQIHYRIPIYKPDSSIVYNMPKVNLNSPSIPKRLLKNKFHFKVPE